MSKTYNALEGTLTVRGAASASRTGTTNAVALVGGYDAGNAASGVNANESTKIEDPATAEDQFGDSELARAAQAAAANGPGTIYGIPLPETTGNTESINSGDSITLSNTPLFNPDLHPDHDVTVKNTDTSTEYDVNVVYDDSPSAPSESDTANVNPINGKVKTYDSANFDITYDYVDDYATAIEKAASLNVRNVIVGTEDDGVTSTLQTELADIANDFDFKRGFVGADPDIAPADISSYTPNTEDWRIVETAPALGTGADGKVRTCFAVGGFMAAQPIGPDGSGLFEPVNGLTDLNRSYAPSEAKDFSQVSALTRTGRLAHAVTTSSTSQFENIYATEIIDNVANSLFETARSYAGGPQDVNELENLLEGQLQAFARGNPPELGFGDGRDANPYDVNVTLGNTNSVADAGVTIVPYPIAETVNLDMTVSDGFVQFGGAN